MSADFFVLVLAAIGAAYASAAAMHLKQKLVVALAAVGLAAFVGVHTVLLAILTGDGRIFPGLQLNPSVKRIWGDTVASSPFPHPNFTFLILIVHALILFQKPGRRTFWDPGWGRATTDDGREIAIVRGLRGGKDTIELAGGEGLSHGGANFRFRFATDFARAGHLERTTDDQGRELVVFHWAPSTWDSPLEHQTVLVRYPRAVEGAPTEGSGGAGENFWTEAFMNERYLIDYPAQPDGRFAVLLHANDLPADYDFRIQQYVPASTFDAWASTAAPASSPQRAGTRRPESATGGLSEALRSRLPVLAVVGLAFGLFFLLLRGKHGETRKARASLDDVRWDSVDWSPPKLVVSSFRKPGKVCEDLTPIEVAFFLEIPYKRILSVMLQRLIQAGFLEIEQRAIRYALRHARAPSSTTTTKLERPRAA